MNPVYAMERINTWWENGNVDPALLHKRLRSEFSEILASLGSGITNITGPCGCGKTALLHQTIHHLLASQVPARRILLLGGDEMTLFGERRSVGSLLDVYATDILHEDLFALTAPVYVFLDDVERIEDWQIYVLNYAQHAQNLKFFVAQGLGTRDDGLPPETERRVRVMPLTQVQFAEFFGAYRRADVDLLRFKSLLPGEPLFEDPSAYYRELSANVYPLGEFRPYKSQILEEYLLCGGYPGFFHADSPAEWLHSLLLLLDRSLYLDVAAEGGIRAPLKLKKLLFLIASRGGVEQSYGSIGRSLYLDTSTTIAYIAALSGCGIAEVAENFSPALTQAGRVVRKNRRFYVLDTGVSNAFLRNTGISAAYDALVLQALRYLAHEYARAAGGEVFFWKDGKREVDLVLRTPRGLLPVSVNYQREISERRVRSLRAFMKLYGAEFAVLVTKDKLDAEDGVYFIPYWMI